ncbi:hypothetical protein TNCV_3143711 [Trichonephila clavipes]|nr:hypothetical protein TNCV_3143491 [Trichonephila clavipes]GFV06062.1 hypothetical protein TNCV_3143522 [Trichonephila clavipes]GFV06065.1 hypothetical protein TNCV_3143551 [Trichonephila clavipes]GFV06068.1 hypothetical protein TNCV_3143581 [Trichonephila clavipes]GFV06071.1 hypothetical protein TNCV_3143611 [Trichonephila clavipes]
MASANQIAGKWSGCPSGRQIHSVAVPAELFCPLFRLLILKILMKRYVPVRDRHSVIDMPLATCREKRFPIAR